MTGSFEPSEAFRQRYLLGRALGQGAGGYVFRATQLELGRAVAIKLIPLEAPGGMRSRPRFEAEARTLAALRHPGILTLYDHGTDGDVLYLVMELAVGKTLREEIVELAPLRTARIAEVGRQLAGALDHLHARGIVHRDVKPDNVFVMDDGRLVLGDFGLALESTGPTAHTTADMVVGTPRYMAPELLESVPHGPATDLYALGMLLYELAAGRPPFLLEGSAFVERMSSEPAPSVRTFAPETPPKLTSLIDRLIDRRPEARPASAAAVLSELALVEPSGGLPPRPRSSRTRDRRPRRAQAPPNWPLAIAPVGLGLLLALALLRPAAPLHELSPSAITSSSALASLFAERAAREATLTTLRVFDAHRRAERLAGAWRAWLSRLDAASPAARAHYIAEALTALRRAQAEHGVRPAVDALHLRLGATPRALTASDLPVYLALNELSDLGTMVHELPGGPERWPDPIPTCWRERMTPALANPHAVTFRADWKDHRPHDPPEGPYASHCIESAWTVSQFGDLAYSDAADFVASAPERPPPSGLGSFRWESKPFAAHPADAAEIGLDVKPARGRARLIVQVAAGRAPWRTIAVMARGRPETPRRGAERCYVSVDPELLRSPDLKIAIELVPIPGVFFSMDCRVDWLSLRWR